MARPLIVIVWPSLLTESGTKDLNYLVVPQLLHNVNVEALTLNFICFSSL